MAKGAVQARKKKARKASKEQSKRIFRPYWKSWPTDGQDSEKKRTKSN